MFKKIPALLIFALALFNFSYSQNIAVNSTGTAAASTNMFEVTQTSTAANMVALYAIHSGATGAGLTGYGLQAIKTGATGNNVAGYFSASGGANNYSIIIPSGGGYMGLGTSSPVWPLDLAYSLSTTATNARGAIIHPTFTNSGDGPAGIETTPVFTPSANLTLAYGLISVGIANPPAGVTIANVTPGYFRFDTQAGSAGAVTSANVIQVAPPVFSGIKPANMYGINIANQGFAGITASYGLYVSAQTGATNSYAAIFNGGNVGLGTTTPLTLLDINKSSTGNTLGTFPTVQVQNTNAAQGDGTTTWNYASSQVSSGNGAVVGDMFSAYNSTGIHQNGLYIRTQTNHPLVFMTNSIERMRVTNAGNVGIGTQTPGSILQVRDPRAAVANISNAGAVFVSATNNGGSTPNAPETVLSLIRNGVSAQSWENVVHFALSRYVVAANNSQTQLDINLTGQASDNSTVTNVMSLRSNGYVGIGTTSPVSPLHIYCASTSDIWETFGVNSPANTDGLNIGYGGATFGAGNSFLNAHSAVAANGKMNFMVNFSNKMVIQDNGNVGIGISAPVAKFHVDGLTGRQIMTGGATAWADISSNAAGRGVFGGNVYTDWTGSTFHYSQTHGSIGAVGFATNYPTWNQASVISSGTTASTAGTAFTPAVIATFDYLGNVGIGTTSPVKKLSIDKGAVASDGIIISGTNDTRVTIGFGQPSLWSWANGWVTNGDFSLIEEGVSGNRIYFKPGGNVGIGTATPGYLLQVGNVADGTQARANAWNLLSDKRLKKDFEVLPNAIEKVMQLNGYYYYWKTGKEKSKQFGVISQEVQAVLPEVTSVDAEGYISVDYSKLTPLLINAIKEQQKTIDELKNENTFQKKEIENLNNKFGAMENTLKALQSQIIGTAKK